MPTPEEIKEYIDEALCEWSTKNRHIVEPWHQVVEDLSFIASNAIQNLSKNYCIVPRNKVMDYYKSQQKQLNSPCNDPRDAYEQSDARSQILAIENIFGTDLLKEPH